MLPKEEADHITVIQNFQTNMLLPLVEITTMPHAMQLHAQIIKTGQKDNTLSLSKLINFSVLSKSGDLRYAHQIFNKITHPNSYFWNTMIRGYAKSTQPQQALNLFLSMQQDDYAPKPDKFTYPFLLKACVSLGKACEGKQFHALIYKSGLQFDGFIQNSLIHMYSSCGESDSASSVFKKMGYKDVVTWTSMIDGYVDDSRPTDALELFEQMHKEGIEPNDATVVSVLRACADAGALSTGKKVHLIVEQRKKLDKANVYTALIDMYAKCGYIDTAKDVFNRTIHKDVFAWTTIISGFASHGKCKDAIEMFDQMLELNLRPDVRTITAVLAACRNAGWAREGYSYFNKMEKYGIRPTIQHYGCMVDLLARTGRLDDAERFIERMTLKPDAVLWRTLIWACKIHGDTERAERLMNQKKLLQMDSTDTGTYVLVGNVYASRGKWHEKAKVRVLMTKNALRKPVASSRIEVNGVIHEFTAGDTGNPEAEKIYRKLDEILEQLRMQGYCPKLSEVLLDIEDEEKAFQLHHHSEKLAVAFGLISTNAETKIQIVKNLRSCEDCHSLMKLISKVYEREIVIRDRIRFHHFSKGECSCGDYW